jgi:peptidoglycan/LPS O-acetylase OafA/YrhL
LLLGYEPELPLRLVTKPISVALQNGAYLPGIHGLRGIAALAVVLYHLIHIGSITPPKNFGFMGENFGFSVHLFFVVSAFSLMHSASERTITRQWLGEYFIKRFFRIAPLFYAVILFELLRQVVSAGQLITGLGTVILNMTFTFGLVPFSSLVWGGWSIGVEMIFYVFFPLSILAIRTPWTAFLLLIVAILGSYCIRSALYVEYLTASPKSEGDWSYFSLGSNACFFAMGIFAYRASVFYQKDVFSTTIVSGLTIALLCAFMFLGAGKYFFSAGRSDIIIWGLGFMGLCIWQSRRPAGLVANSFFEYLGERSFSIYLLHPIIIFFTKDYVVDTYRLLQLGIGQMAFFVCAAVVILLVLSCAEVAYRFIELPGISAGKKLISKLRANEK